MKLTDSQLSKLQEALSDAYRDEASLQPVVFSAFGKDLPFVADGDNLTEIVYKVVKWAERHDRVKELIDAAVDKNPTNKLLQELQTEAKEWDFTPEFPVIPPKLPQWLLIMLAAGGVAILGFGLIRFMSQPAREAATPVPSVTSTPTPTSIPATPTTSPATSVPTVPPLLELHGSIFNIAVAQVGRRRSGDDAETAGKAGEMVSKVFVNSLQKVYRENYEAATDLAFEGEDGVKAVDIGYDSTIISGNTAREQASDVLRVSEQSKAHLVVYGYLSDDPNDPESQNLDFRFYYTSGAIRHSPDAVNGQYILGKSISLPKGYDPQTHPTTTQSLASQINDRARALFWITLGLGQDADVQLRYKAYPTFQKAKVHLADLRDNEFQGLLSFFVGRQALWEGQYITATRELSHTIALMPDFPNAYHTLALVHFDQAQLAIAYPDGVASVPTEQSSCYSEQRLNARADPPEIDAHLDEALRLLEQAIHHARTRRWYYTAHISRLTLGLVLRMQAQSYINRDRPEDAVAGFKEAEETLRIALDGLADDENNPYIGWTHLGLGLTYQYRAPAEWNMAANEGVLRDPEIRAMEVTKAKAWLEMAITEYAQCIDLDVADYSSYNRYIVNCGCKYYQAIARTEQQKFGP